MMSRACKAALMVGAALVAQPILAQWNGAPQGGEAPAQAAPAGAEGQRPAGGPPGGFGGAGGPPGGAGGPPGGSGFAAPKPLVIQQIKPNVYYAQGVGGNVGIIIGQKAVTVVDTTVFAKSGQELLAKIAAITPKPVTTVILTHGDIDHAGGLNGFPAGITIIAHPNAARHMKEGAEAAAKIPAGGTVPPFVSAEHMPTRLITATTSMTIDGVSLRLITDGPAHTDGDIAVYLPGSKVVFAGDMLTMDQFRQLIHPSLGGSPKGWVKVAGELARLDADRYLPGHGTLLVKSAMLERVRLVTAEQAEVTKLAAQGKSLQEIQAAVGDPPPGPAIPNPAGRRFVSFSEAVYNEATGKK
jgi:cyclase